MLEEVVNFRTNSKLEKLVGRELITNNIIAIFELIKNSYDAGASQVTIKFEEFIDYNINYKGNKKQYYVNGIMASPDRVISLPKSRIIIEDNGCGMSFADVKKYWMEIGTVHKELVKKVEVRSDIINRIHTRILNGEKGIGRFGTDKLGASLLLTAINRDGKEKTLAKFNWDDFDDHTKMIQDVDIKCVVEQLPHVYSSGVNLEIGALRDEWTIKDIENIKNQLKKFVSPFSQETAAFSIYIQYGSEKERIVNDAFEYAKTSIEANINENGLLSYQINDDIDTYSYEMPIECPIFGPVELKILYMDSAAKRMFTTRTGITSRLYGNIKLFRDNFRVYPYGEPENDWLGIDNRHAQAVFRSLGTRDIIGYVQISNARNSKLKDTTSRVGLVEDTLEFEEFKKFIWRCIEILQDHIFKRIKIESEKQGKLIKFTVEEVEQEAKTFQRKLASLIESSKIDKHEARDIIALVNNNTQLLETKIDTVRKANNEITKRMRVYERIMGSEGILYDILHVIKNKTALIQSQLFSLERQAQRSNLQIDAALIKEAIATINKLVFSALRKTSSARLTKKVEPLRPIIQESVDENLVYARDKGVQILCDFQDEHKKVYCNKESIKIVFDNLFSNSFKALDKSVSKTISISTKINEKVIEVYFTDSGPGIKEEDVPFIFNVGFTRTKGSGLGLASSLDIIQGYQGDLSYVKLYGSNEGSTFLIKLPICP